MDDREHQRREQAYKIWEDEGRPDGRHEDHWHRADESASAEPLAEQASEDVTKVNQEADEAFAGTGEQTKSAADIRPPSAISPD